MSDLAGVPRPSQLWKQMADDRRWQAATAFWRDENAQTEHSDAIATISGRIKFRPKSVRGLSTDKKTRYLVGLTTVSELVAARLLVSYHVEHQRPLMGAFLDALGLRHEDGLLSDDEVAPPDPAALRTAAAGLTATFPADDVALYLTTLIWQDPEAWGPLSDVPEARIRTET